MHEIIELLEEGLFEIIKLICVLFEIYGTCYIVIHTVKAMINAIKDKAHIEEITLDLLKSFAAGLTFLLAAEILKTITITNMTEVLITAGIVAMRVTLAILIHWEESQEEAHIEHEHELHHE
ncbi:MAG: DUF1622 domain-containing protein [Erysipelotrichaceae bacterium]|nr:DUF1622 domain-containing protein [Erysipelotrichaceae bacterium]